MSLRYRIMDYLGKEGGSIPYQEIAEALNCEPQQVRQALKDASREGYVSFARDDVTGHGGYTLTTKGVDRIKEPEKEEKMESKVESKKYIAIPAFEIDTFSNKEDAIAYINEKLREGACDRMYLAEVIGTAELSISWSEK